MNPEIKTLAPKLLVGLSLRMSLAVNRTSELWRAFMPRRSEIQGRVGTDFISMQLYDTPAAKRFEPTAEFTKWAVVEVANHDHVPAGMEARILNGGLYAVFHHQGPASAAPRIMGRIFGEWLPASDHELDDREHFEVLPENYSPVDPQATEEIWIPIRERGSL